MKFIIFFSTCFFVSTALLPFQHLAAQEQASETVTASNGELRYISDDLFTFLRAGPSREFRLIGSVAAGTEVRLLQVDRAAGYVEIIDDRQRTGWVETKFVTRNPSIRIALVQAQVTINEQNSEIENLNNQIDAININLNEFNQQKLNLNRQITEHLEEINELNQRLSEKDRTDKLEWFTRGTILALISVNIGYIMGLFGRRQKKKERLL